MSTSCFRPTKVLLLLTSFIGNKIIFLISAHVYSSISESSQLHGDTTVLDTTFTPSPEGFAGENSRFGSAIDIDGNMAVISSQFGNITGVVNVFEFSQSTWQQTATIKPNDFLGPIGFGHSVSLDGNSLLIGTPNDYGASESTGSAYLYEWDGTNWQKTHKLIAKDGNLDDHFGHSVSLENNRIMIGAAGVNDNSGAVYIFEWDGGAWNEAQKIVSQNINNGDRFGESLSLQGNRAVIGAIGDDNGNSDSGSAFIFESVNGVWSQVKKLTASDGSNRDSFGTVVAIDTDRILVSAYKAYRVGDSSSGAVYVYDWNGFEWEESQKIISTDDDVHAYFGSYFDLDNDNLIVGAPILTGGNEYTGSAYIFSYDGNNWGYEQKITNGHVVAINAEHTLVGNPLTTNLNGTVSAYIWNGSNYVESHTINPTEGSSYHHFGHAVSISGNHTIVGTFNDNSAYINSWDGSDWSIPLKITPSGLSENAQFGHSVSIQGEVALVGAPNNHISADHTGSILLFEKNGETWQELIRINAAEISEHSSGFGRIVSLNNDRFVVVAGVAAYVFDKSGESWGFSQELVSSSCITSISLFGDTILAGCSFDNTFGTNSGAAYIFEYNGTTWIETQKITASNATYGENFGHSVSIDGDWAVISAPYGDRSPRDDENSNLGSVFVYQFNGLIWEEQQIIYASDANTWDQFGISVSLSGGQFLVGANQLYEPFDSAAYHSGPGKVYRFTLEENNWSEKSQLLEPTIRSKSDGFGTSVSLDGTNALVGVINKSVFGIRSGIAYLFGGDLIYRDNFEN